MHSKSFAKTKQQHRTCVPRKFPVPTLEIGHQVAAAPPPKVDACRQLWAEVLRLAIEDSLGSPRAILLGDVRDELRGSGGGGASRALQAVRRRAVTDARRWVADDHDVFGSFVWICELLDLNPEVVRKRIARRAPP